MLGDWLNGNLDYIVFATLWAAFIAIKQLLVRRSERLDQRPAIEWAMALAILILGGWLANAEIFLHHRWLTMALISPLVAGVAAITTIAAAWRAEQVKRQQTDQARCDAEQKLHLHSQQTPLAVIECNLKHEITEWNTAAEKIFGYTKTEVLGRNVIDLLVPAPARADILSRNNQLLSGSKTETGH